MKQPIDWPMIIFDAILTFLCIIAVLCLLALMQYNDYVVALRYEHRHTCASGDLVVRHNVVYCSRDGTETKIGRLP